MSGQVPKQTASIYELHSRVGLLAFENERPSEFLGKLYTLGEGKVSEEFIRTAFLKQMPEKIRYILDVAKTLSLKEVVEQAERIWELYRSCVCQVSITRNLPERLMLEVAPTSTNMNIKQSSSSVISLALKNNSLYRNPSEISLARKSEILYNAVEKTSLTKRQIQEQISATSRTSIVRKPSLEQKVDELYKKVNTITKNISGMNRSEVAKAFKRPDKSCQSKLGLGKNTRKGVKRLKAARKPYDRKSKLTAAGRK